MQRTARTANATYPLAVKRHAACLREINDHQIRTRIRTSHDAEVLADLYKAETSAEEVVASTQNAAKDAEDAATEAGIVYRELIQKARHEEQLWRDKIQYWSTWGTLILVGSNLILWFVMEPWRRRRIVREIRSDIRELREEEGRAREGLMREMAKLWPVRNEDDQEEAVMAARAATMEAALPSPANTANFPLDTMMDGQPRDLVDIIKWIARGPWNRQATVSDIRPVDLTKIILGAATASCVLTASIVATVLKRP